MGVVGRKRKDRHKAAKRQSLGTDALSLRDPDGNGDSDRQEDGGGELSCWRCLGQYSEAREGEERATHLSLYEWDLKVQGRARTYPRLPLARGEAKTVGPAVWCVSSQAESGDGGPRAAANALLSGPFSSLPISSGAHFIQFSSLAGLGLSGTAPGPAPPPHPAATTSSDTEASQASPVDVPAPK